MIVSSQIGESDLEEMLAFYKAHFHSVEVVRCDNCNNYLALELMGDNPMGLTFNEIGKLIIPIGDKLLSYRIRLDEAPNGERMIGYQCGAMIENPDFNKADIAWQKAAKEATKAKKDLPPHHGLPKFIPCGNDTRLADVERGHVPVSPLLLQMSPFEKMQLANNIRNSGYKADFKVHGNKKIFETFSVERIK